MQTGLEWLGYVVVGVAGLLFYGRFYVQWYYSERAGKSVMPTAFWYMSGVGSLLLLGYGVVTRSPNGTLSHCFNTIIYSRNLVHVHRNEGSLSHRGAHLVTFIAVAIALGAFILTAFTWYSEWTQPQSEAPGAVVRNWFWIGVGVVGQGLFAARFLVQWVVSESRRESVIPTVFWWFSLAAAALLMLAHLNQAEWLFALGLAITVPVYIRNLWLIHHGQPVASPEPPLARE